MSISVGDNFQYLGEKPLDARLKFATVEAMVSTAQTSLYNGILAYVEAQKQYYSYDASNTVDQTLGKWRVFNGGGGGGLPSGGTAGQYLVKQSSAAGDAAWADLPLYEGSYEVTPLVGADTIMQTQGTYLDRDVVLKAIPYTETTNLSGGKTATIGG